MEYVRLVQLFHVTIRSAGVARKRKESGTRTAECWSCRQPPSTASRWCPEVASSDRAGKVGLRAARIRCSNARKSPLGKPPLGGFFMLAGASSEVERQGGWRKRAGDLLQAYCAGAGVGGGEVSFRLSR